MSDNSIDGSLIVMKDWECENANTLDGDYINWLEEFTVRFPSFSIESFIERLNDENVPIDSIEEVMIKTIQKIKGMG